MNSTIAVQEIDPRDEAWAQREAHLAGISMENFVRRIVHEKRERAMRRSKPSDAFRHYFGPEHGVELLLPCRFGQRRAGLTGEKVA